jgi:hypothetical protein
VRQAKKARGGLNKQETARKRKGIMFGLLVSMRIVFQGAFLSCRVAVCIRDVEIQRNIQDVWIKCLLDSNKKANLLAELVLDVRAQEACGLAVRAGDADVVR